METTYTTSLDDLVAAMRHVYRKSIAVRRAQLINQISIPVITMIGGLYLVWDRGDRLAWTVAIGMVVFGVLFAALYPLVLRAFLDRFLRSYCLHAGVRGEIGPISLILSPESLVEITDTFRLEARWKDIHGLDLVGDYAFVFVTGMTIVILPRHAFKNAEEHKAVLEYVMNCVDAKQIQHYK